MSFRQAHVPSTSDGLLGGAFIVVGFVALIVVAAVDLIGSRWSTPTPPSGKPGSTVAPPEKDDQRSTPDFVVKGPIEEPNPLFNVEMLGKTDSSDLKVPKTADHAVHPQLNYPLIPDLDDKDAVTVEVLRSEVPLDQDQHTADVQEIPVAVASDSSHEWVSLSKPDAESLSSIPATDVHPDPQAKGSSPKQQETTLEFTSSTLIDAPNKLHESTTTIGSETSSSSSPRTPEPETHSFDHIQTTHTENQVSLTPELSVEFAPASEILKARKSIPSLYDSASNSSHTGGTDPIIPGLSADLSMAKKKRGSSFIKKSSSLVNKVFKNKDPNNEGSLASSVVSSDLEHSTTTGRPDASSSSSPADVTPVHKKLTSPSRVSLGSIRSISGSIKKKIRKTPSSIDATKPATVSGSAVVTAPDDDPHPLTLDHSSSSPSNSNSSQPIADTDTGPSLLKTMFKIRKPSQ